MILFKNFFPLIILSLMFSFDARAQEEGTIEYEKTAAVATEVPIYEYETMTMEELGFPAVNPAKYLNYQYLLIWNQEEPLFTDKVFEENQLDRLPLFSEDCIGAADPEACSNDAISDFMREHLNYPEKAADQGQESIEKVIFVIDQQGHIEKPVKVLSKEKPCKGCSDAAVNAVLEMPAWVPAMKNGRAVKSKVVLPVIFNNLR